MTLATLGKRNAIVSALYGELHARLAEADPNIANDIVTGANGFFSSGGDLAALAGRVAIPQAEREAVFEGLHDMIRTFRALSRPTIAAIEGGAAGVGASLAFAANLIVASEGRVGA